MDVIVTFSKNYLPNLGALAAACSQNVRLIESTESDHLSLSPSCPLMKNSTSIICFILNVNPLDVEFGTDFIWFAKFIRPKLYAIYKASVSNTTCPNDVNDLVGLVDSKFSSKLDATKLGALELIIWSDLFALLSSEKSSFSTETALSKWFITFSQLPETGRAIKLLLPDQDIKKLATYLFTKMPVLPIQSECQTYEKAGKNPSNTKEKADAVELFLAGILSLGSRPEYPQPARPLPGNVTNILVTSALPYVNNVPHLGNLIGSTLSGDIFARYCRLRGHNVVYVCGTDEYGTATEVKAATAGVTPRQICDQYNAIHKEVYDFFGIQFDVFGRTSDPVHKDVVTEMFGRVQQSGSVLQQDVGQLRCEACVMFLADRFVEGDCPHCGYEDARGDQCDKCSKLVNSTELGRPRCKLCGQTPTPVTSRHLFLDLETLTPALEDYLAAGDASWSGSARAITQAWMTEGLRPRCITRDLKWGVPVPLDGFRDKVFYVWFDAVLGYVSMLRVANPEYYREWWWPDQNTRPVRLLQFMAKDNVPFHSVMLPAILLAAAAGIAGNQTPPLLPHTIAATEYLNYEGTKFSKSRGLGVFGPDAVSAGLHADYWRYYLAATRPENQDSSFGWADMALRCNTELLNNLGNFVNRALSFIDRRFDGKVQPMPVSGFLDSEDEAVLLLDVGTELRRYCRLMEEARSLREALACVMTVSRLGNGYMQRAKPWVLIKSPETAARGGAAVSLAANLSALVGLMLAPFMPTFSARILDQCAMAPQHRWLASTVGLPCLLSAGHKLGAVEPLFAKIEDEFVLDMRAKFGGAPASANC